MVPQGSIIYITVTHPAGRDNHFCVAVLDFQNNYNKLAIFQDWSQNVRDWQMNPRDQFWSSFILSRSSSIVFM